MPTYQYACTECGEQLEAVQSFSDDPLTTCPACNGRLRKVYNSVGIVFKGSGFYRTDSRKGSESAASTTKPDAAAAGSSSPKSDSSSPKSEPSSSATTPSTSKSTSGASGGGAAPKAASA